MRGHPIRGDQVEAWLKRRRDSYLAQTPSWVALDEALDAYRLHADTGTPLPFDPAEDPR